MYATASSEVAMEAFRFFQEWEALSPEQQQTRFDRIMELNINKRALTTLRIADQEREREDSERAQKVAEVIARRSPRLAFEAELFQDGMLVFESPAAFFEVNPPMREKDMEMIEWMEHFKGKVPARWEHWAEIGDDFEKAKAAGVQLRPTLVDAGVSHWHHYVVETTAKTQRLTPLQIAMALEAADAKWFRENILNGQREMGTPEDIIKEAAYTFLMRNRFKLNDKIPFRLD